MRNYRNTMFYIGFTGGFSALIYWIISVGKGLETNRQIVAPVSVRDQWSEFIQAMLKNLQEPLAILLLQIITIILVAESLDGFLERSGSLQL